MWQEGAQCLLLQGARARVFVLLRLLLQCGALFVLEGGQQRFALRCILLGFGARKLGERRPLRAATDVYLRSGERLSAPCAAPCLLQNQDHVMRNSAFRG